MPRIPLGISEGKGYSDAHGSGPNLGPAPRSDPHRLETLMSLVQGCRACPRMEGRRRVLSHRNGRAGTKVLFFAEAPGRMGADRTRIPLHGDVTGTTFEMLLEHIGWTRADIFVTNAVLCNPRKEDGTNDTPSKEELDHCSHHLEQTLQYVAPRVVVPIGAKALQALGLIDPSLRTLVLRECVAKPMAWLRWGIVLFPLYHMSPLALQHRSFRQQKQDFDALRKLVDIGGGVR